MTKMSSRKLEDRLEELRRLRDTPDREAAGSLDPAVRKALTDRSNLVVAEAAKLVASHRRKNLLPELLLAYDRLYEDPIKADPKCWGKTAIVKALTSLDYSESAPFVRGAQHIQMEPVWGGQEDAAAHLRANANLALVACNDITRVEILRYLVNALADSSDTVRIEAIRALEQMNGDESSLLLRLKAHSGDSRPHVLGQVFDSLLQLERERAVPFTSIFLKAKGDEVRDEAALALGASRLPAAVRVLIASWKEGLRGEFASVLLRALSSSREETALGFLLDLVRDGTPPERASALEALALHKDSPEIQALVEQVQSQGQGNRNEARPKT